MIQIRSAEMSSPLEILHKSNADNTWRQDRAKISGLYQEIRVTSRHNPSQGQWPPYVPTLRM